MPPGIAFEELEFRSYRGPALVAWGHADRASFRRDSTDLTASALVVRFPSRPGDPADVLRAARGTGNLRAGTARLGGGAVFAVRGGGPSDGAQGRP